MEERHALSSWPTKIDASGRIMIPADARSGKGWGVGTELVLEEGEDGSLRLVTLEDFLDGVQDYFCEKLGPDRNLVAELRAERKHEAASEVSN